MHRGSQRAGWRRVLLSYPCPTCGAGPGDDCETSTGNRKFECHVSRSDAAERCRDCHTRLGADDVDQGADRCPHCQLVHQLITERHTHRHL
jgi:hypothetical protein